VKAAVLLCALAGFRKRRLNMAAEPVACRALCGVDDALMCDVLMEHIAGREHCGGVDR